MPVVTRLGVVGAGTMGAGIAQIAALAGIDTVVHDPGPGAVASGLARIRAGLDAGVERGRWPRAAARAAVARVVVADGVEGLAGCDVVVEAAPERLDVKREIFASLAESCGPETMLATNTSSIPITAIAAEVPLPERVVGLHFFNPVPVMRLVEVIPAAQTSDAVLQQARAVGEALGKQAIVAQDGPGFLVNRCGRPFYGEALRLLAEGVAGVEQIDRICRMGAGFRMGPFELMDLVGIDVALDVARSIFTRSHGEPRWRPSPLQDRMVASRRLGRKTERGWYEYGNGRHRPADPERRAPHDARGRPLNVVGGDVVTATVRAAAVAAGFAVIPGEERHPDAITIVGDDEGAGDLALRTASRPVVACARRSLASWGAPAAVGFSVLPGSAPTVVELTRGARCLDQHAADAEELFTRLGANVEWVEDAPGLVASRIVAQIVNEACFAVGEGVATAEDVDAGVRLGLAYPHGPLAWGQRLGWGFVAGVLDGVWRERREERYRPAPWLLRAAADDVVAVRA